MLMFGRTRRENEDLTPTFRVTYGLRDPGISDLRCPWMEEVLRAPAEHGVSSTYLSKKYVFGSFSLLI